MSRRPPYVRDALVLSGAVGVFGLSFGVLATTSGLSVAQACALSALTFTGASQFAAVGVAAGGGSMVSAVAPALLLAARNAAYGLALAPVLRDDAKGLRALLAAHFTIDETTAMATARPDPAEARHAFWVTGVALFTFWNLGTLVGATAGNAIGNPASLGLDAAFPAGFIALVAPHLRRRRGQVAAIAGATVALVLVPLTPAGTPILAAALGVIPAVLVGAEERVDP